MKFLRNVLATLIGLIIFFGIAILILVGIASTAASEQEIEIAENSVLKIELNKPIVERDMEDPFSTFLFPGTNTGAIGLISFKETIQKAKTNDNIKGIYLDAGITLAGFASLEEIRNALLDFKESGKFIIAYSEIMTEQAYYLASVADSIYLHPQGDMEFNGFAVSTTFVKETLEKIGLEPQVFKVGDFKSAVEPFTRTSMSDSSRIQTRQYLENLYSVYLEGVSNSRNMTVNDLRALADSMKVRTPGEAKAYGLITDTAYYDMVVQKMGEAMELEADEEGMINPEDIKFVSLKKYEKSLENEADDYSRNRIAVIVATGTIVNGEGEGTVIGGETFAREIRKARLDDNVRAIVLRINSGGGSALASDVMWREVQLAKKEKPVIASLSDVAASGGYYMAMGCDTIVAHPNSITGSIGVFILFPNVSPLLDKIGIQTEVVETGEFSNFPSLAEPLNETEEQIIQNLADRAYEDFTLKAARGRGMSHEALKEVASGRVWSGLEAKDRNLIDVFGGLDDAIAIARESAGLEDDYQVRYYPRKKTFLEQIMSELDQQVSTHVMKRELGIAYPYIKKLKSIEQMQGVQARLPFEIEIH